MDDRPRVTERCARHCDGDRIARWTCTVLLALGTYAWWGGREDHGLPTADLHADADYYYVYLPSLLHGDLDFENEYRETKNWYHFGKTPNGHMANVFGIGPALLDVPIYVIGHGLALATGSRSDGFSKWEVRLYTWSSLAWSIGAILVAYRFARRRLKLGNWAIAGPVACALAGPIVYYAVRQPGYAHPMATFFAAWFVEQWDASYDELPRTMKTWVRLGALLGAAALARPQLVLWGVLLVGPAIDDLRIARDPKVIWSWLAGAAAAFVVFAPQLVAWKIIYGEWYLVPQGEGFMRWDDPCWSEALFSSRNGLFPWSPAYAVFLIGLVSVVRTQARIVLFLLLGIALQAIANGAVWDWWAGGSFGGRRFDSTYIAFAFGAAAIVAWIVRIVPPAFQRDSRLPARVLAAAALLVGYGVLELGHANLRLVARTTTTNARIYGGEAAWKEFEKIGNTHGWLAARVSALSNLPARALFAWKHDVPLDTYDRVVGVHVLGDTYAGLNSFSDTRQGTLPPPPGGHGRVLVGLNRRGDVDIVVPPGATHVYWNGAEVPSHFRVEDPKRGVNDLDIEGDVSQPIVVTAE